MRIVAASERIHITWERGCKFKCLSIYFCKQIVIICYFVTFNESTTQYHDTTLSKQIILLLHHVSISAERPQINTRRYDRIS